MHKQLIITFSDTPTASLELLSVLHSTYGDSVKSSHIGANSTRKRLVWDVWLRFDKTTCVPELSVTIQKQLGTRLKKIVEHTLDGPIRHF